MIEITIFCSLRLYHVYTTGLNFLTGTLPSEIGSAKALKILDIREFVGLLSIKSMTSIKFFIFFFFPQKGSKNNWWEKKTNQLSGQIPSEIGAASNLELINFCKLHLTWFCCNVGLFFLLMIADLFRFFYVYRF